MLADSCNIVTLETQAWGDHKFKPTWSTQRAPDQLRIHSETLSHKEIEKVY